MKKKLIFAIILVVCAIALVGCEGTENGDYFINFPSRTQFNCAVGTVALADNVSVYSYDAENDVFITYMKVINAYDDSGEIYLYGLASAHTEYVAPTYTAVLSLNGDYAVVTKPAVGTDSGGGIVLKPSVGVVKFRGENTGELTAFDIPYESGINQFAFAGDYIVSAGTKEFPLGEANFSTFYDYSQGVLLEAFRIRCGPEYTFTEYDGFVVATGSDHAFFYETDSPVVNGYIMPDERGIYLAYPEDTEGEYSDAITLNIYYIGNGWFSRTARLESTAKFEGYNIMYEKADPNTGETQVVYANIRCDFYDAKTRSATSKEWLIVDAVANAYSADYYAQMASHLNNLATFDESTGRYEYSLPFLDAAQLVKDGYSIVYYYYFPYVDQGSYQCEVTFCIMDEQANVINIEDALMPVALVDGNGVETSDPMYDKYYGSVFRYDENLTKSEIVASEGGVATYASYLYHEAGIVAAEINYRTNSVLYGIVAPDGRRILDFRYDELSPFYGGYAIGSRIENGTIRTYRIDTAGNETLLNHVVNVRQGVYVFDSDGKLGLMNYAGSVLMEAEYEELDVFEIFMSGGELQRDYVVTKKDGKTSIFILN